MYALISWEPGFAWGDLFEWHMIEYDTNGVRHKRKGVRGWGWEVGQFDSLQCLAYHSSCCQRQESPRLACSSCRRSLRNRTSLTSVEEKNKRLERVILSRSQQQRLTLTTAAANMFSGSRRRRKILDNCTAIPRSGSGSEIIWSMITFTI